MLRPPPAGSPPQAPASAHFALLLVLPLLTVIRSHAAAVDPSAASTSARSTAEPTGRACDGQNDLVQQREPEAEPLPMPRLAHLAAEPRLASVPAISRQGPPDWARPRGPIGTAPSPWNEDSPAALDRSWSHVNLFRRVLSDQPFLVSRWWPSELNRTGFAAPLRRGLELGGLRIRPKSRAEHRPPYAGRPAIDVASADDAR